ncbi:MAG: deaminase [Bdellovibrionales bacterium RIFOXYC1_FULL_54_43]|nr:MAG: deaminase [Bdellovibrionales bacterium RIFOXYC1_FULL_54_43]OFZ80725.1 MAG: deaminase [Bdellovibrionales bacterium RIFOXYD1_FULL_55_31]
MITGHAFIATSLDGFIARSDGDIQWLLSRDDPSEDHGYNSFIRDIDGIVMGRGSYEKVRTFDEWPYTKPVLVLSKQLAASPVPSNLHSRLRFSNLSPRAAMDRMERDGWRRVYVDGGQIILSFLREGLIDDMVITRIPVLIGAGRPLFGPLSEDISLTHLATKAYPSGLVQSHYRVKR